MNDEGFDPRSIPLQRWDDYADANNLPGRRGVPVEKNYETYQDTYEMDDMKSMYSAMPASQSVLRGMQGAFMPPQSPGMPGQRQSVYTANPYMDTSGARQSMMSLGGGLDQRSVSPYQDAPYAQHRPSIAAMPRSSSEPLSTYHLSASQSRIGFTGGSRSPLNPESLSRPVSQFDFRGDGVKGPDDSMIVEAIQVCLREVDLDSVTKKQVRALVEQRLQTELVGERRTFLDRMIDQELASM